MKRIHHRPASQMSLKIIKTRAAEAEAEGADTSETLMLANENNRIRVFFFCNIIIMNVNI